MLMTNQACQARSGARFAFPPLPEDEPPEYLGRPVDGHEQPGLVADDIGEAALRLYQARRGALNPPNSKRWPP